MAFVVGATYVFTNKQSGTVADFNQWDKKSVIGDPANGGNNQHWTIESAGSNLYYIKNGEGVYLSIGGSGDSGSPLLCTSSAQKWRILADSQDSSLLKIYHPTSDICMDLAQGSSVSRTPVILHSNNNGRNQAWRFDFIRGPFEIGATYVLTNKQSGTVADFNLWDKKSIIGDPSNGGKNQHWTIQSAGSGLYYLKNGEGVYLSIGGSGGSGSPLLGTSTAQKWKIVSDSQDSSLLKIFHPTSSDLCMDLSNGSSVSRTPVLLWGNNNGRNQAWKFTKV